MSGKKYGPTAKNKMYVAIPYHQRTAQPSPHKSRWVIKAPDQYKIFDESDCNGLHFPNADFLVGLKKNCSQKLGVNQERLAKFIAPSTGSSDWHGFPVLSREFIFSEAFLDILEGKSLIDSVTRHRLAKCKI